MKKMIIKSSATFILSVIMLIVSVAAVFNFNASAATTSGTDEYFNYKANYIKNNATAQMLINDINLPYRYYLDTMNKDTAYQAAMAAWKVAMFEFDDTMPVLSDAKQSKYYESILMDLLTYELDISDDSITSIGNWDKVYKSLHISVFKKFTKASIEDLNELIDAAKKTGSATDVKALEDHLKGFTDFKDTIDLVDFGEIIGYLKDANDLVEKCIKVKFISDMSVYYADVFEAMANQTSNTYLKTALNNIEKIVGEFTSDQAIVYFCSNWAGKQLIKEFTKAIKKSVVEILGLAGVSIEIAQSLGKEAANLLFGTEQEINYYYEMSAFMDIEDLLKKVMKNSSGKTYCLAFSLYENTLNMGLDYTRDFIKNRYTEGLLSKLVSWLRNENYDAYAKQVEALRTQIKDAFFTVELFADGSYVSNSCDVDTVYELYPDYEYTTVTQAQIDESVQTAACLSYSVCEGNNGKSLTLQSDLTIINDFNVTGGTVYLNGHTLKVNGDLNLTGGSIQVGSGRLEVTGDLNICKFIKDENGNITGYDNGGYIFLNSKDDYVLIQGNLLTYDEFKNNQDNSIHLDKLIKGTIELKGNLVFVDPGHDFEAHHSSYDDNTFIFSGSNLQEIKSLYGKPMYFDKVQFKNPKIQFDSTKVKFNKISILVLSSNVSITPKVDSVQISWKAVPNAIKYRILQKTGTEWETIGETSQLSYKVSDLKPNTEYSFVVLANLFDTWSEYTEEDAVTVTTGDRSIRGISVTAPTKVTYYVGEDLDLSGGKITVSYDYGDPDVLSLDSEGVTVSGYDKIKAGKQTITVKYEGYTDTFEVTVKAPKAVKSFTVVAPKPAPKYYTGDAFDPTGYTLTVTYDDKTTDKDIPLTLDMVSGYNPDKSGSQKLTVTYGGQTATLTITVTELKATALSIVAQPKTQYYLYDALDLSAGMLNVTYNNGKSEEVPMTDARITTKGFDSSKTGTKKVTITLLGKSVTVNMEVSVDPNNAPVVIGTSGYETIADALKANTTGDIEIVVNCDLIEAKAITLPKTLTSAIIKTVPGKTLNLTNLTITANCDVTIDAAIEPAKTGKTLTIKSVADKKVTINRLDSSLPLTLSGTKTTNFMLATGDTIDVAAANTVNVDIAADTTVRLTKVTFKPTILTGSGTLDICDASNVTLADVTGTNIILNQYNKVISKNVSVMIPKLTIGTASDVNITVYDPDGELADISGKSVFTLAKNSTDSVVQGISIVNKSGTNTLSPVPYKKDVRAEWTGSLTMTCNGTPTDYSSFEKALEAITANAKMLPDADYVITMNASAEVTKLAFPAKAGSLTIDGSNKTLTLTGITNIAPKYAFTLNNITLIAQTNKGVENALTISCSTGDTVIDGLSFTGKSLTIKGGSKNALTLGTCSAINSLTGYTTMTINAPVEIEKTLTAADLTLGASANVTIDKGAALTVNKVLTGTSGAKITLADGFKPIALKGTIEGDKIKLVSTDSTKFDDKQIFAAKLDLYGMFDVTGIATDASFDLALQSGKVYLKPFVLEMGGKKYAFWNDVISDIEKAKISTADYTIKLLADFDIGSALKLPGKGKYHSLTIDGGKHNLTFIGASVTLTGETTLKNITVACLDKMTRKQVMWTLNRGKYSFYYDPNNLINCIVK